MYVQTSQGNIAITQVDESTKQPAEADSSDWNKGEEIVLVELEGGDWRTVPTSAIKENRLLSMRKNLRSGIAPEEEED